MAKIKISFGVKNPNLKEDEQFNGNKSEMDVMEQDYPSFGQKKVKQSVIEPEESEPDHSEILSQVKDTLLNGGKADDVISLIDKYLSIDKTKPNAYQKEESTEEKIIQKLAKKV
jgi:hypothetical protein